MTTLYTSKNDIEYKVKSIPSVALLNSFGIFKGSRLIKKNTYKMGGPVLISVKGRGIAIGKEIAMQIELEEN